MRGKDLDQVELRGYFPGAVGRITELHAVYYHLNWGFDVTFETQVGRELSQFISDFNPDRDGFWVARLAEEVAGSSAIDGRTADRDGARLRWLIVDPRFHGRGIGSLLVRTACRFCADKGYRKVYLWTFQGLDQARHLYESVGFRLSEENPVSQWGRNILEQRFDLDLNL
jgi:GNAT superfamily N-acetyltransferase